MHGLIARVKRRKFLFEELVKRDFRQKYKRTLLGMGWSILNPLLTLLILYAVFGFFFGKQIEHFTIYLFCGNVLFAYFQEATSGGMSALVANARIFTKVNIPKYLFLLSRNVSSIINFALTLVIFFIFIIMEPGLYFNCYYIALLFPIGCLIIFNIGVGMVLSALYIFFRDIMHLYNVFLRLLVYASAIFYPVDMLPADIQQYFFVNPVYCYIYYFRSIVLYNTLPSFGLHMLCLGYASIAILLGMFIYKRYNHEFLYYV